MWALLFVNRFSLNKDLEYSYKSFVSKFLSYFASNHYIISDNELQDKNKVWDEGISGNRQSRSQKRIIAKRNFKEARNFNKISGPNNTCLKRSGINREY